MYARRQVLSLVPAYEVCVCKWEGTPCTYSTFLEMVPRPVCLAGPTERVSGKRAERDAGFPPVSPPPPISPCIGGSDPSPPKTGQPGGGGTVDVSTGLYRRRAHRRELGPRDHVTGHMIAWPKFSPHQLSPTPRSGCVWGWVPPHILAWAPSL